MVEPYELIRRNITIYGPGLIFVSVLREINGTIETKSEQSELIFRPIPCKRMQRNVWRPIRTQTGLSSSQSLVNTPQDGQPYRAQPYNVGPLVFPD